MIKSLLTMEIITFEQHLAIIFLMAAFVAIREIIEEKKITKFLTKVKNNLSNLFFRNDMIINRATRTMKIRKVSIVEIAINNKIDALNSQINDLKFNLLVLSDLDNNKQIKLVRRGYKRLEKKVRYRNNLNSLKNFKNFLKNILTCIA